MTTTEDTDYGLAMVKITAALRGHQVTSRLELDLAKNHHGISTMLCRTLQDKTGKLAKEITASITSQDVREAALFASVAPRSK